MTSLKKSMAVILFTAVSFSVSAQKKELSDEQYIKGNFKGIIADMPRVTRWLDDGNFLMLKDGKTWQVEAKTGKETPFVEEQSLKGSVPVKPRIITKGTDLFLTKNTEDIQLTNDKDKEVNFQLSPDGNFIAYTKNNDLYTVDLNTKKETRLTNDGTDLILNGFSSWVYMEEILGRATQNRAFWWSPDSKKLAFFRSDDTKVPVFTLTNAKGLHGEVENTRYPKVGDPNPEVKVGIVNATGGPVVWAAINEKDDQYFGKPEWTPNGNLLVQWMPRSQDQLKIYSIDLATGAKTEFYTEQQKTWISLDETDRIHFLNNGKGFLLNSDATGWKHLYFYDMAGKLINPVTSGKYQVTELKHVDEKNGIIYFTAKGGENTARTDFYSVRFDGKKLQRLSSGDFNHSINLSPNGSYFISTYNNVGNPSKISLFNNKGKLIKELGTARGADFDNYNLAKTEYIRVKSDDGLFDLPMKVTWPLNMDKNKKYPVLISIYGGPDAGSAWDTWGLTGMQQWYAKEGMIQVVMDHRASGHFGKAGVNYMHRDLGNWELVDYTTMVKWLIANGSADPKKIAITGFSYGGYMTTLALTKGADVFTHGMAGGPVTDWTLYDSHYTERFMDLPAENTAGYKTGNVMNYVDQYKGMLQIVHGEIDDNVHMQNTLQLVSKLQDAKKDFELMIYPGGRHGWGGNKGLHFQNLKTKFIYKYLLEKELPKAILK